MHTNNTATNIDLFSSIPFSQNLKTQLDTITEPIAIADLFAEAGIWYDALAQAISLTKNSTDSRFELKLLEDLAKIEDTVYSPNNLDNSIKHSYKLRQVIEAEKEKSSFSSLKI